MLVMLVLNPCICRGKKPAWWPDFPSARHPASTHVTIRVANFNLNGKTKRDRNSSCKSALLFLSVG